MGNHNIKKTIRDGGSTALKLYCLNCLLLTVLTLPILLSPLKQLWSKRAIPMIWLNLQKGCSKRQFCKNCKQVIHDNNLQEKAVWKGNIISKNNCWGGWFADLEEQEPIQNTFVTKILEFALFTLPSYEIQHSNFQLYHRPSSFLQHYLIHTDHLLATSGTFRSI